jgi:glutamyl endopeptidase
MSDDLSSSTMPRQTTPQMPPVRGGRPNGNGQASSDDLISGRPGTGTAPRPGSGLPTPSQTRFSFKEVEGDPVTVLPRVPSGRVETTEAITEAHAEVGADSAEAGEEFVEATPAQIETAASGAEAGEESALSDLRQVEGFSPPEFSIEGAALRDAGAETESSQQEFLPILAALIPTLVSTVGPMVAKAISSRLSARAKSVITRVASQAPRPPTAPRPGSAPVRLPATPTVANLLPILARLLQSAAGKAGESGATEAEAETIDEGLIETAAAAMETIIGADQRLRITNTNDIPWRRYCALRITFPSGASYRGTGFFIGPTAVATAGHCVYLHNQGGWARRVEVIPGCNGSTRPFGQAEATVFRSVSGWVTSRLPECDYGCIFLPRGSFGGANLGNFGAAAFDAQTLVAQPAVVAGYQGDKPFAELWGMAEVIKTVSAKTIGYTIDTYAGASGAPVYIKRGGVRYAVAIHNYGGEATNSATRITEPVYQRLLAWSRM